MREIIAFDQQRKLAENLAAVRARIAAACQRAGRPVESVRLVAITKYVGPEIAAGLVSLGLEDLGESRPQVLWEKAESLSAASVRWHLVGSLQRNKIRRTLPWVHLIHSVDSLRLLEGIDRIAVEQQRTIEVLLEVNVSGDANKQGLPPQDVGRVIDAAHEFGTVRIHGLMCMGGLESTVPQVQHQFASLRELRDSLRGLEGGAVSLAELSMGMSDDFELAIAEGSTVVRIGSLLFAGLR